MPRRDDLRCVLILGSGPIVIGQACEFDYSGVQACRALRREGYRVVLVNSNPATIMTDPDMADATYVEPLTAAVVAQVIAAEHPDALLPTLGGQTALNIALELADTGVLDHYGVELIGAGVDAIRLAEDRRLFTAAMHEIGLEVAASARATTVDEAETFAATTGYPLLVRSSFTLGGAGSGMATDAETFRTLVADGLAASPIGEVQVDESLLGWKEYELEVMRDAADNCVVVCAIENLDAMGVHTGDSITVAPAQTLSDVEYQAMRDAAFAVLRRVGVATGGSNVQFAVDPADGRLRVVEMNPRVSRSSALASKATGFPIAKIAALLAVGYTLDEIPNDITRETLAAFEPSIDYVVTKLPRFAFEKFPDTDAALTTRMKSVGEVMAIGRTFKESLGKALRSLDDGTLGLVGAPSTRSDAELAMALRTPSARRLHDVDAALTRGWDPATVAALTGYDPWFVDQLLQVVELRGEVRARETIGNVDARLLRRAKRAGLGDAALAAVLGTTAAAVRARRLALGVTPVFKTVDSCAAEFRAHTPYHYSTYEDENEAAPSGRPTVVILGSGPNRIGQGIEFDYCCVHAVLALRDAGYDTVMVNCNPETVSTDYDTADRLYFEPLTLEDVLAVTDAEAAGDLRGVLVQLGGQTPLRARARAGRRRRGDPRHAAGRDRPRRGPRPLRRAARPAADRAANRRGRCSGRRGARRRGTHRVPGARAPVVRPGWPRDGDRLHRRADARVACRARRHRRSHPGRPLSRGRRRGRRRRGLRRRGAVRRRDHGAHRGGRRALRRLGVRPAALHPRAGARASAARRDRGDRPRARHARADQHPVRGTRRHGVRAGGQPRASRTTPFVSKATGVALAKVATRVMLGATLSELRAEGLAPAVDAVTGPRPGHVAVKEAVMPFNRFPGVDTMLGPEMRSTGEVMGIDRDLGVAFAKSQAGTATMVLPTKGTVFVSVADRDKRVMIFPVKRLADLGFAVLATEGTAATLRAAGVDAGTVPKVSHGTPNVVDRIDAGEVDLVLNTPAGSGPRVDGYEIRTAAVRNGVPCITTLPGILAAIQGIEALRANAVGVRTLQAYHADLRAARAPYAPSVA